MIAAIDQFDKFVLSAVARAVAICIALFARRGVRVNFFDVQSSDIPIRFRIGWLLARVPIRVAIRWFIACVFI